jgi:DnaK suppressor protein
MFVSLLQLMGFPMGKPVHSRAEETRSGRPRKGAKAVAATSDDVQEAPARRQEVNAKSGKESKAKEALSKAKPVAAKAPAKLAAKPTAKAVVKAPASQPSSSKAAVKTSASDPVKTSAKTAEKISVKTAVKVAPAKPKAAVEKPVVKPAPASVAAPAATAPAKAGRPSSRLAQLTVPSMAQTVASTAAKSSYNQTMSSPVITPVIPAVVKKDAKLANNWKNKTVTEMTDAELLAMPDSEYMNEMQLAYFRLKLTELKRGILASAGETTEHLREDTSVVPDPADRATIEEEHALELRTRDRERKLLKKIEQSIARIDAGDYGYCDETGEPIGVGRLLARPTATLSLEAQQRRELKQKMFGD